MRIQTLLLKGVLHEQYINLNEGKNSFESSLNNLLHIDNNVMREDGSVFSKYNPEKVIYLTTMKNQFYWIKMNK